MKHRARKIVSMLLAISMIVGMCSFGAIAAESDEYVFEYTMWHQRAGHCYKMTDDDALYWKPSTYLLEGVSGTEVAGQTFVNYCCDLTTSAVTGYLYRRVSIDDVTGSYYTSAEADRIRAVVVKGYNYQMTDAELAALATRATNAGYPVSKLTRGEALAATQHAVWVYGNSGGTTGAEDVEVQYTYTTEPSKNLVASPLDYSKEKQSDLKNQVVYTYPSGTKSYGYQSATTKKNIESLKKYLLDSNTDKDVDVSGLKGEVVFTDQYFVKSSSVDAEMSKGKYVVEASFRLEGEVTSQDELELLAKQGSTTIYKGDLTTNPSGALSYDASTKTFTLTFVTSDLSTGINLTLSGDQYLTKGVYRYESEVKNGVSSQSFVGIGEGLTPVHATKSISLAGVEVENPSIFTTLPVLSGKSAVLIDEEEQRYGVTVAVPGEDPDLTHNEIILMLDASDSQGGNWTSVKESVMMVGRAVLPETIKYKERATMAVTLMGFGISGKTVLQDITSVEELEDALEALPTADAFLNGQSATNCEVGFTHIEEYLKSHADKLQDAYVIYISDSECNTSSEDVMFHEWPENQSWWYFYNNSNQYTQEAGLEQLVKFLFKGSYSHFRADGEFLRALKGEDIVPATENIVGITREGLIESYLTRDMVESASSSVLSRLTELGDAGLSEDSETGVKGEIYDVEQDVAVLEAKVTELQASIDDFEYEEEPAPDDEDLDDGGESLDGEEPAEEEDDADSEPAELAALKEQLAQAEEDLADKKQELASLKEEAAELQETMDGWEAILERFEEDESGVHYVYGDTSEAEEEVLIGLLSNDTSGLYDKFWTDTMCQVIETTDLRTGEAVSWPVWRAWIDQLWYDVYTYSDLQYGSTGYPVEVVEAAFLKYDKDFSSFTVRWTENVAMSFYFTASMKYPFADSKNKGTPEYVGLRAAQACDRLAGMEDVKEIYLIGYGSKSEDSWMNPWRATKYDTGNYVQADNVCFYKAASMATISEALKEIVPEIVMTIHSNVEITDYMSKWVTLDLDSIKILKDDTCICRYVYDEETGTGECVWTIPEEERPTADIPIQVTIVAAEDYPDGGPDVEGNQSGSVYKIIWRVKDDTLLVSDRYSLCYEVLIDTEEPGYQQGASYVTNGNTTATYDDPDGPKEEEIEVPNVVTTPPPTYSLTFTKEAVVSDNSLSPEWPVDFYFTLTDESGTDYYVSKTFSSEGQKTVKFEDLPAGTYTLTETESAGSNWSTDFTSYEVTITDEDVVISTSDLVVTNRYFQAIPEPDTYSVSFTKKAVVSEGSETPSWPATFSFLLTSSTGRTYNATATFTAEGEQQVTFANVLAGTYTLTETSIAPSWSTYFTSYEFEVVDEDVVIPASELNVTNRYFYATPEPDTYTVSFTKDAVVAAGSLEPEWPATFTFKLTSESGETYTASETFTEAGKKVVSFSGVLAGSYTLTEESVGEDWSTSFVSYPMVVTDADVVIAASDMTVTNSYYRVSGGTSSPSHTTKKYDISFTKEALVSEGSDEPAWPVTFTFQLKNSSGTVVDTKTVTFSGSGLETVTFKDVRSGTYTISEVRMPANWSSDDWAVEVKVAGKDVVLPGVSFTNIYSYVADEPVVTPTEPSVPDDTTTEEPTTPEQPVIPSEPEDNGGEVVPTPSDDTASNTQNSPEIGAGIDDGEKLPQTGLQRMPVFIMAALGGLILGVGVRKRKKEDE